LVPTNFGGYPWQKETKALLDSESPYSYVDKINTPLLIIHGDQDLRTGVIQSEMLYKSLKILNKPVEYIRYPKEGHELTRSGNPGRMMDHLLRVIEFFERYAKHP
jgi:dipeptidyl aminopeptidase/acylaminoacyl peptidase